jgi:class 3 adenylate cyclase
MDAPPIQYARTDDGLNIAYWTIGDGPPLLLSQVPSLCHIEREWQTTYYRDFYLALAQHFSLIRFDYRGCGLSDRSPSGYAVNDFIRDLDAVVTAATSDPVVLGVTAISTPLLFALAQPDRVSHLVLWSPLARGADYEELQSTRLTRELREVDPITGSDAFAAMAIGFGEGERVKEQSRLIQETGMVNDDGVRAAFHDYDLSERLANIDVPTLILHGRDSRLIPTNLPRRVAAAIPGAEMVITPSRSTFPWTDDAETQVSHLRRFVLGQHADSAAGVTQTILFTDVEASTDLTDRFGDAKARDLLREHERLTREALAQHGGTEIKTMGDGFMASFTSASGALDAAIAMQRAITDHFAETETPIRIRVGINAGEPIEEDDDLYGTAVIQAARVMGIADGGQILVTDTVRNLVAGKDYRFHDHGTHDLKGFEEPARLFEAGWESR